MEITEFDRALVGAAFELAGREGWAAVSVARAAREAGLDLAQARIRFPGRAVILLRFGQLADHTALSEVAAEGPPRDRLFDLLMRRIDVHQAHRAGVLAVLRAAAFDPGTGLLLASATRRSMGWMLEGAGLPATGRRGDLLTNGLMGVWLWTIRTWSRDESEDMGSTMAALDDALQRAGRLAEWTGMGKPATPSAPEPSTPEPSTPEPPFTAAEPTVPDPVPSTPDAGPAAGSAPHRNELDPPPGESPIG